MLATVTHMMNGTPYIYQGEEIGMTNKTFTDISQFNDLMAKFHYQKILKSGRRKQQAIDFINYFSRDHARLPMQWDNSVNAGFSTGKPWLALNNNQEEVNAQAERDNEDSIFHYYRRLIALRKSDEYGEVITYGKYQLLEQNDPEVYAYQRSYHGKTLLIIANFSKQALTRHYDGQIKQLLLNNYRDAPQSLAPLKLAPYQVLLLDISNKPSILLNK